MSFLFFFKTQLPALLVKKKQTLGAKWETAYKVTQKVSWTFGFVSQNQNHGQHQTTIFNVSLMNLKVTALQLSY